MLISAIPIFAQAETSANPPIHHNVATNNTEKRAVAVVLRSEREIKDGKILRDNLQKIMASIPVP